MASIYRKTLRRLLSEPETAERFHAAKQRGDPSSFIEALRDPEYRVVAAKTLGEMRAREAVGPLLQLLRAGDAAVRASAAHALGRIGAKEAVPELLERVSVDDERVPRAWAVAALGMLGDRRALKPLCRLLDDPDVGIRAAAAAALGDLGLEEAIEPLRASCRAERWFDRRPYRKAIRQIEAQGRNRGIAK